MIHIIGNPWAWSPLVIALVFSAVAACIARKGKSTGDRIRKSFFFDGPAFSNAGAASTLVALLPILLSPEVRQDVTSASLLSAASLLFSAATFIGFWLYSTINAQPVDASGTIELQHRGWAAAQAVIISLLLVGAGCFVGFVLFTNVLDPSPADAAASGSIILECNDAGCKPRR